MERLDINNIEVVLPESITLLSISGEVLKFSVYDDIIEIETRTESWSIVNESKLEFERIINKDNMFKTYLRRNFVCFLEYLIKIIK